MKHRAEWMFKRKWGVMCHWLADFPSNLEPVEIDIDTWNKRVDNFNVKKFVKQLQEIKCGWLIFTVGQNSGYYCSPNETYDEVVGRKASRLSKRDLIKDLGEELNSKDIKLIVYLPSGAPKNDTLAVKKFKWYPVWDKFIRETFEKRNIKIETDERLSEFQKKWEAVIREWSERWGKLVSGWWFDGCYYADRMYNHPDPPNFKSFSEAARSGNPESIVAFNGGKISIISLTEYEDYTAGEVGHALPVGDVWYPLKRFIGKAQLHILTFQGETWGKGKPRFSDDFLINYTKHVNSHGGAITYDFPPPKEWKIPSPFFKQLKKLGQSLQ